MSTLYIYTDGACKSNPGPAGCGALLRIGKHERHMSKYLGEDKTNNYAELNAVKLALSSVINKGLKTIVTTDSQYVIGVLTKNFKTKKNIELVAEIKGIVAQFPNISFQWVRGHSGHQDNELVDRLANQAIETKKDSDERIVACS